MHVLNKYLSKGTGNYRLPFENNGSTLLVWAHRLSYSFGHIQRLRPEQFPDPETRSAIANPEKGVMLHRPCCANSRGFETPVASKGI